MNKAFSLLELSIVLVIIGLIAGGIVAGASMIRAAELRAVISEETQFKIALNTFRDKYFALPGDMKNATRFWGAEPAANCPGDETTPSTTSATCDGDGSNTIEWGHETGAISGESHRFWQHLANAELISGSFTGVHSIGTGCGGHCEVELGLNAPESKLNGVGWTTEHIDAVNLTTANYFPRRAGNVFHLGTRAFNFTSGSAFTPAEAWNLDKKNDDGKPGTGRIHTWSNNYTFNSTCTTSPDPTLSEYNLALEEVVCPLIVSF